MNDAQKLSLPHPELIKPFLQNAHVVEEISSNFAHTDVRYKLYQ